MKITDILNRLRGGSTQPKTPDASSEQKFELGDFVTVSGKVGRIASVKGDNVYSVKYNTGQYEHDVSVDRITLI